MVNTSGRYCFFLLAVFVETAAIILFVFLGNDFTAKKTDGVFATPPYIVAQPQFKSQPDQAGMVSTIPLYIVPQFQQQVAQAGEVSTTPLYIVPQSQQQVAQAGEVSTTPLYIVPQSQQQVAQAGGVSTTPPDIAPQSQQQSEVKNLSESLPQNAVLKVYQQVVDEIPAKKIA
jgi:hypothetical protein